jgi:hypothetical protein
VGGLAGGLPFPAVGIAAAHVAGGTEWDALTAVGTLALAAVTLVALAVTIRITRQDRARADKQLKDERDAADARLRDERTRALDAEQESDAWAVEILPGTYGSDESDKSAMTVLVSNLSRRTIVQVDVFFSPEGSA